MKTKTVFEVLSPKETGKGKKKRKLTPVQTVRANSQFTNLAAVYGLLRECLEWTYEQNPRKRNTYPRFMEQNLRQIKLYFTKSEQQDGPSVTAPCRISEGSLPVTDWEVQGTLLVSSLEVPSGFELTPQTTLASVSNALTGSNDQLRMGDKLTIVQLLQGFSPGGSPRMKTELHEFTLQELGRAVPFTRPARAVLGE